MSLKRLLPRFSALIVTIASALTPTLVNAQLGKENLKKAVPKGFEKAAEEGALFTTIGAVVTSLFSLLGVILLGYLLWAGYLWMTAGGTEEKVTKARTMIKNAIIGLVIIALSYAISNFVIGQLAGQGAKK